jgi:RNA polymerase sigma-70 factor, ECF subfamily
MDLKSEEYLSALKNGEDWALERTVKAYTNHLYNAALGLGFDQFTSEDLCHNTWETFFKVVSRFEGRSHIRTFLFGIFYKKAKEIRRKHQKHDFYDLLEETPESMFSSDGTWQPEYNDPQINLNNKQILELVDREVEKLPSLQRPVFYLKIMEDKDTKEICNILDITPTHLRQLVFRTKNKIRMAIGALNDSTQLELGNLTYENVVM